MEKLTTSLCTIECTISRRILREYTSSWIGTLDHFSFFLNLMNHYFTWLQYFIPLSCFRAYHLGHFDIKTLFLLRSYYKTLQDDRAVVNRAQSGEPSKDHQGQVSVTATRQSMTAILDPQGPQSATCGRVGLASPYTPQARPGACARAPCQEGV